MPRGGHRHHTPHFDQLPLQDWLLGLVPGTVLSFMALTYWVSHWLNSLSSQKLIFFIYEIS